MKQHLFFAGFAAAVLASYAAAQPVPGRYIVELSEPPASAAVQHSMRQDTRRTAMQQRRGAVLAEQARMRRDIEQPGTTVISTVDTVANMMAVLADANRAAEIAKLPGVKHVYPVMLYHPLLDHAIPLQHVTEAWNQIGGQSKAGLGIKVGIIDTGIDSNHPAFLDPNLPAVNGFPLVNRQSDTQYTNNKIIVARSYDSASPAIDIQGHGTAVAMVAAGETVAAPRATITGVAPKAYLGNYKVFPDTKSGAPTDEIISALDDAAKDGMDVVNLSLGSLPASFTDSDPLVTAVEGAYNAGVVVVIAAGNDGPNPNTIGSPGTSPDAITVGNAGNDRRFVTQVRSDDGKTYTSMTGSGTNSASPIHGPLLDVSKLDNDGQACNALPNGSLTGHVALILRGTCFFENKLTNAANAGAIAAVIYTDPTREVVTMDVGAATLPAVMVSNADGADMKSHVDAQPDWGVTVGFDPVAIFTNPTNVAVSSSRGPNVQSLLKPDILAVGTEVYTAAPGNSYAVLNGTSLASPMVTGAVALVKAARPGLTPAQYRSLIVNSASPLATDAPTEFGILDSGSGFLNVFSALNTSVTASPTAIGFGVVNGPVDTTRQLTITNISASTDTYTITLEPFGCATGGSIPLFPSPRRPHRSCSVLPAVDTNSLQLDAGQSQTVRVHLLSPYHAEGEYQGYLLVTNSKNQLQARIPYWFGVPSKTASYLTVLLSPSSSVAVRSAQYFYFRVTDAIGTALHPQPKVTVVSGGGKVDSVQWLDTYYPGVFGVQVHVGATAGANVFEVDADGQSTQVTITSQ